MDSRDIEKWRVELDSYAHEENGVEYWLARDLMVPMGYTRWENFAEVVKRAKVSCETNKTPVDSHFRDTTKMVTAGVAARAVKDFKLTRYACYLIAQNGDPNKPEIALAQAYFAVQAAAAALRALRAALVNAYAFPQLRALSGSTPCVVNKKDGQLTLTVLTCFGGPSGGRTLDLGIKSPLLYQLS